MLSGHGDTERPRRNASWGGSGAGLKTFMDFGGGHAAPLSALNRRFSGKIDLFLQGVLLREGRPVSYFFLLIFSAFPLQ